MQRYRMSLNVTKHAHTETNRVTANNESVMTSLPVRALVPRLIFRELLVCGCGKLLWELRVGLAGVDEQRCFALREVSLQRNGSVGIQQPEHPRTAHIEILGLEQRRVANDGHADDVLEGKIEHEAG